MTMKVDQSMDIIPDDTVPHNPGRVFSFRYNVAEYWNPDQSGGRASAPGARARAKESPERAFDL